MPYSSLQVSRSFGERRSLRLQGGAVIVALVSYKLAEVSEEETVSIFGVES
jgi:hypothetical protein